MTIKASSLELLETRTALPYCCAVALAIMSTGLDTLASAEQSRRRAAVDAVSLGTTSPLVSQRLQQDARPAPLVSKPRGVPEPPLRAQDCGESSISLSDWLGSLRCFSRASTATSPAG